MYVFVQIRYEEALVFTKDGVRWCQLKDLYNILIDNGIFNFGSICQNSVM